MNAINGQILEQYLKELRIPVSHKQLKQLLRYIHLLTDGSAKCNIISTSSRDELLARHILDCAAAAAYIKPVSRLIDIGSGGGLPGIILAVLLPQIRVVCIDSKQKKTDFIIHAIKELQLRNCEACCTNIREYRSKVPVPAFTARAYASIEKILKNTRHLCDPGSCYYLYKGTRAAIEQELHEMNRKSDDIIPLRIPLLDAQRHLVILKH